MGFIMGFILVGGSSLPLWKRLEFVNWDDDYSKLNGKIKNVPNHQPDKSHYHYIHLPYYNYPQDEGFAQRANPKGWPSNHQPIRKTFLLLGFHLGLIQVIKPPGPVKQFAIFLLGFPLGFIQVIQVIKPPGPMEQFAIFLLGFHLGFIQVIKAPGPTEQLTILYSY